jgi:hypothetical protein
MKNLGWKFISIIFLPIQFVFFKIISSNPDWIEDYYSKRFFKSVSSFLRIITSPFNFSVGLVLVYILSFILFFFILKEIIKLKKGKTNIMKIWVNVLAYLSPIYLFFMLTWGLAYHKVPIENLMDLDTENIKDQELIDLCKALIYAANQKRSTLSDEQLQKSSFDEVFEIAPEAYRNLKSQFSFLEYHHPSIKKAAGSDFLAYMNTSGVYMFPSGEANININNMLYDAPYVTTHEMAHQMGFASEDEANFLAFLACRSYPNPLFQYSAYYGTVFRALNKVWEIDSTLSKELYAKLDPQVIADREMEKAVWIKFKNPFQRYIVSPFYDLFLKSNGQEEGSRSYDLVLDLMVAERRKAGY